MRRRIGVLDRISRSRVDQIFEDMGEKEFGHFHGVDGFGTRDDNYPLHKAVVDHDKDRVFAMDFREVSD